MIRIAPLGLVADDPFRTGCDFARLLGGAELEPALDVAEDRRRAEPDADETLEALGAAREAAADGLRAGSATTEAIAAPK